MTTRYLEREDGTRVALRGTSNGNDRGSAAGRRARRAWLLETYRADVDAVVWRTLLDGELAFVVRPVRLGTGERAARCYRCALLLVEATISVDRIIPGCQGGTYRRTNIRPACGPCNSLTGGSTRRRKP